MPSSHVDYRPDSKSKTGLGLVRHITLEDEWILNSIVSGQFPPPPDDSDACGILSPADAAARYRERMPAALARVGALPGEKLCRIVDLLGKIQAPAINFLAMAVKHPAHPRGQLSNYLRAMRPARLPEYAQIKTAEHRLAGRKLHPFPVVKEEYPLSEWKATGLLVLRGYVRRQIRTPSKPNAGSSCIVPIVTGVLC